MTRLLVLTLFASGCSLYWGGDDTGDDVCNEVFYGDGGDAQQHRDPSTGTCESTGGGGYYCCDSGDGTYNGCAIPENLPTAPPTQNWGACYTTCDGLDELTCEGTSGCHAAYLDSDVADQSAPSFVGCWATAPVSTTVANAACATLDAQGCSEHDECSMVYSGYSDYSGYSGLMKWEQCIPEAGDSCNLDCGAGAHCEQQCDEWSCGPVCVADLSCASTDCGPGYQCVEQCAALVGDDSGTCWPTCVPTGNDPGSCTGAVTCDATPPSCPANTTAGIANGCYSGFCIPNADCGTHDPGNCYDAVTCSSAAPACPSGTLPGVVNGCYSGYCVPTYGCEIAACETLGTESACQTRTDCSPVYQGNDCTCDSAQNCTCQTETFTKCESLVMPL